MALPTWSRRLWSSVQAREIETGNIIAIKAIRPDPEDPLSEEHHRQEVELHSIVGDHPNIVTIHNSYESPDGIMWIGMDLCEGGDLKQCLNEALQDGIQFRESLIWSLFSQLVSAIRNCHDPDSRTGDNPDLRIILHRDLKPENILLNHDRSILKLADFCLAIALEVDEFANSLCGTKMYQAPEILEGPYDQSGDIWALGCILYELCCFRPPFMAEDGVQLENRIKAEIYAPIPSIYSESLSQLIASLLHKDPKHRMQHKDLLSHPGIQLGLAETRAMEAAAYIATLEERLSMHEVLVQAYETLEAKNQGLQKKLERQAARHENKTKVLLSEVESLKFQLEEARIFSQERDAALDAQETALHTREEACEKKNANLRRKEQALETKAKSQQAEAVAMAAQQTRLEEQQKEIDEKLRSLARREQTARRQEPAIKKTASESSAPVVAKPTTRTAARKVDPLAARSASKPDSKTEVTRPVASDTKSAPIVRRDPSLSKPMPKSVAAGTGERRVVHARPLKDIATQPKTSASTIAPAVPGKPTAIPTKSLPTRREKIIAAPTNVKPTSSNFKMSVKPPTQRLAEDTIAEVDALIAKSRQARKERNAKAKSVVTSRTDSKRIIKSAANLAMQERLATTTTGPRPKWSAEDVRRGVNQTGLPNTAEKRAETTPLSPVQTTGVDKPMRNTIIGPKKARPSLIPMSNRLRTQYFPRAIAIAA